MKRLQTLLLFIVSLPSLCSKKGINDTTTRCLWFGQTFLFGFASLGLLLKYDPERPKQHWCQQEKAYRTTIDESGKSFSSLFPLILLQPLFSSIWGSGRMGEDIWAFSLILFLSTQEYWSEALHSGCNSDDISENIMISYNYHNCYCPDWHEIRYKPDIFYY